jgi:hypothetical protein
VNCLKLFKYDLKETSPNSLRQDIAVGVERCLVRAFKEGFFIPYPEFMDVILAYRF